MGRPSNAGLKSSSLSTSHSLASARSDAWIIWKISNFMTEPHPGRLARQAIRDRQARQLLERFADGPTRGGLDEMRRELALEIEADRTSNGRLIRRMPEARQLGLVLLIAELLTWSISIAAAG
jgi:hypothetical protein